MLLHRYFRVLRRQIEHNHSCQSMSLFGCQWGWSHDTSGQKLIRQCANNVVERYSWSLSWASRFNRGSRATQLTGVVDIWVNMGCRVMRNNRSVDSVDQECWGCGESNWSPHMLRNLQLKLSRSSLVHWCRCLIIGWRRDCPWCGILVDNARWWVLRSGLEWDLGRFSTRLNLER